MSEEKPLNVGGPAFPLNWERKGEFWAMGVSVRDYYAAKAMQALIMKNGECHPRDALDMADAMLEERNK